VIPHDATLLRNERTDRSDELWCRLAWLVAFVSSPVDAAAAARNVASATRRATATTGSVDLTDRRPGRRWSRTDGPPSGGSEGSVR
jgi:hypothetical protein